MSIPRKAYIRYHNPQWADPVRPLAGPRDRVQFSHKPEYGRMHRAAACTLCDRLNAAQMCSGDHVCVFDIEEVRPGRFSVCCIFHPDFAEGESSEALSTECALHVF